MTAFSLDLPLPELRDLAEEIAVEIDVLEGRRQQLIDDAEQNFNRGEKLLDQAEAISHELAALADRLEDLDDEIAWREQPRFGGGVP